MPLLFLTTNALALLLVIPPLARALDMPDPFWTHLMCLVGAASLTTSLLQYGVAAVTRSPGPTGWQRRLPYVLFAAGICVAMAFGGLLPEVFLYLAALVCLAGVRYLQAWVQQAGQAGRKCAARPHPALAWYLSALLCLALGLAAVLVMPYLPAWQVPLGRFHAHVMLYGFLGLTALATLQVLMPITAGRPDPDLAHRLEAGLPWALSGVLFLASGQALHPMLHIAGLVYLGVPLAGLAQAWWRLHRSRILALHGAAPLFFAALLGFALTLVLSLVQGIPGTGTSPFPLFLAGFLCPLLTGLAGYLAPLWANPEARQAEIDAMRNRLNHLAGIRGALFLASAFLLPFAPADALQVGTLALAWSCLLFAGWLARFIAARWRLRRG